MFLLYKNPDTPWRDDPELAPDGRYLRKMKRKGLANDTRNRKEQFTEEANPRQT
jgi:hypothetical protein